MLWLLAGCLDYRLEGKNSSPGGDFSIPEDTATGWAGFSWGLPQATNPLPLETGACQELTPASAGPATHSFCSALPERIDWELKVKWEFEVPNEVAYPFPVVLPMEGTNASEVLFNTEYNIIGLDGRTGQQIRYVGGGGSTWHVSAGRLPEKGVVLAWVRYLGDYESQVCWWEELPQQLACTEAMSALTGWLLQWSNVDQNTSMEIVNPAGVSDLSGNLLYQFDAPSGIGQSTLEVEDLDGDGIHELYTTVGIFNLYTGIFTPWEGLAFHHFHGGPCG
jgi:hypothetical protein